MLYEYTMPRVPKTLHLSLKKVENSEETISLKPNEK